MAEGVIEVVLAAPERTPIQLQATEVTLPGMAGVLSVLPGHTPLLSTLGTGVMVAYTAESDRAYFAIHGGFLEVDRDTVTILADAMERADRIDVDRAEAARERAVERLNQPSNDVDLRRAEAALARAKARLQAHSREGY